MEKNTYPVVSIIVPTNKLDQQVYSNLVSIIESAKAASIPFELLFVQDFFENSSNIHFLEKIRQFAKVIKTNRNSGGSAVARQLAIQQAKGKYLLFTDSDSTPEKNWVKKMVETIQKAPNQLSIYAGKVLAEDGKTPVERVEMFTDAYRFKGEPNMELRFFSCQNFIAPNTQDISFDPHPKNYLEDLDLSLRLRKKGYKIFLADTTVFTRYPQTFWQAARRKIKHGIGGGYVQSKYSKKDWKELLGAGHTGAQYLKYLLEKARKGNLNTKERALFLSLSAIFVSSAAISKVYWQANRRTRGTKTRVKRQNRL